MDGLQPPFSGALCIQVDHEHIPYYLCLSFDNRDLDDRLSLPNEKGRDGTRQSEYL